MAKPVIIGLTGQTGAGKSTVAEISKKFGIVVINADKIAKEALKKGSDCLKRLEDIFGSDIIKSDGSCDRKLLARKAFSSPKNTELLNKATHSWILDRTKEYIALYAEKGADLIIFDASQLYESGGDKMCDFVITVTAPHDIRLSRIISRDNLSEEDALLRMNAQHKEDYYTRNSDFVIDGSSNIKEVEKSLENIIIKITEKISIKGG